MAAATSKKMERNSSKSKLLSASAKSGSKSNKDLGNYKIATREINLLPLSSEKYSSATSSRLNKTKVSSPPQSLNKSKVGVKSSKMDHSSEKMKSALESSMS